MRLARWRCSTAAETGWVTCSKYVLEVELRGFETRDPLDANSWRRGRSRSLGQVAVCWRLVGVVLGRWRCCTSALYDCWSRPVRPCRLSFRISEGLAAPGECIIQTA